MMPHGTCPYDVFASYRPEEPDKTWVRRNFVPAEEAAGLRVCLDHDHHGRTPCGRVLDALPMG